MIHYNLEKKKEQEQNLSALEYILSFILPIPLEADNNAHHKNGL